MTKSSENVRRMVLCAMFTALVAVCSQIAVPMPWGVPINLALFAVYMAGTMLGPVWGTASQVVFIALAAIGVPVLANFQGGPSAKMCIRDSPRGFGGTPEFKAEEGPLALSANSNTAFA